MNFIVKNKSFIATAIALVVVTFILALYVANLLFGKNSYEVYTKLLGEKTMLKQNIKRLQIENAKLQKQYLELKNLEPDSL